MNWLCRFFIHQWSIFAKRQTYRHVRDAYGNVQSGQPVEVTVLERVCMKCGLVQWVDI